MNIPYIEKYPEDLTGVAKTNLVRMEPFVIRADGMDSIKTAKAGLFYTDSVQVYDKDGIELRKWWDYRPIYIFPEATKYTGQSVTGFIQILNTSLIEGGYMTYQVVGGRWGYVSQLLVDLLWSAVSDNRNVFYDNVLNKPSQFPPSYHTHSITNTTGWEVRVGLVEQIIDEIIVRADDTRAEYLLKHVDVIREYVDARYDEIVSWVIDHKDDSHAHGEIGTTAGAGNLDNLKTATTADAIDGKRVDVRLTVGGMKALVDKRAASGSDEYIHNGILPITRYGSLLYLEPSIQGTYEGSSQYNSQDARVMIEEYDGTIVRLRPGTNGTSAGVYYDYMYNPFTDTNAAFIRTNSVYWPSDMGLWKPLTTRRSTPDLVWGLVFNTTLFPLLTTKGFISITNGTFDQTKHTCAFFDLAFSHPQFGNKTLSARATMSIIGNYVYCFDIQNWGSSQAMGVVILRTPVSGIKNGDTVVFEVLSGFTSTGGPFGNVVGAGAFITPKTSSNIAGDTAMFYTPPGITISYPRSGWSFHIEHDDGNNVRLVWGGWVYSATSTQYISHNMGWRCTIDIAARRVVWVDSPLPVEYSVSAANLPVLAPNNATLITHDKLVVDTNERMDEHGMYYISPKTGNSIKAFASNEINTGNALVFGQITNWDPNGLNWDVANRIIDIKRRVPDITEFGSAVNNIVRGPVGLPNGYVNIINNDANNNGVSTCAKYTGDNNYPYKVMSVGTILGYAPTTDRVKANRNLSHRYISYWDGSKLLVNGGLLTPFTSGTTSRVNADGSLVDTSEVTWNTTELNAAAASFASTLSIAADVTLARCDIMLHPNTTVPPMAIVMVIHRITATALNATLFITKVNYSGPRTGNITGYSLVTTDYLSLSLGMNNATGITNGSSYQPGCSVYRNGNYLLMSLAGSSVAGAVGGANTRGCNLVYDLTTGTYELANWFQQQAYNNNIGYWSTILEDVGMVTLDTVATIASIGTVMAVLPMGNTRETFKAFDYNDKSKRFVLVAQEVTQGWVVYFTESQPVILNGREDVAEAMSIDLRNVSSTPANRTFYVYITDVAGKFVHQISATSLPVNNTRAYLGTVKTGADKIDSIDIPKKTRIDMYQLSTEKLGASIPVSTGDYTKLGDWSIDNL